MRKNRGVTAAAVACFVMILVLTVSSQSNRWLSDAPDEQARLERLERYLRGFDQPMWEVGERYDHVE